MLFIGDVHGKYRQYKRLIRGTAHSVQVGDMGVGFIKHRDGGDVRYLANPPHYMMKRGGHRFIRGNHDNPAVCRKHSQWIPDGYIEGDMMFVGGAMSIDRESCTQDFDWWEDEQLSYVKLDQIIGTYLTIKPRIMVTHDCPEEVGYAVALRETIRNRTGQAFQAMWNMHKPEIWIFGHYHRSFDCCADGTRFVCLAELEAKDIEV